ncbi:MAG: hypothetical protein ACTS4Z_00250 [Candidatus Hodgkinia cicadicola]
MICDKTKPSELPRSSEVCCKFIMLDLAQQTVNNIGVEVVIKLIAQSKNLTPVIIWSRELEWMLTNLTEVTTSDSNVVYLTVRLEVLLNTSEAEVRKVKLTY